VLSNTVGGESPEKEGKSVRRLEGSGDNLCELSEAHGAEGDQRARRKRLQFGLKVGNFNEEITLTQVVVLVATGKGRRVDDQSITPAQERRRVAREGEGKRSQGYRLRRKKTSFMRP